MMTYCIRRFLSSASRMVGINSKKLTTSSTPKSVETAELSPLGALRLSDRCLVRVSGRDTDDLLQGLLTSDVTELNKGDREIYAQFSMMLNVQGRVMFDLILYNMSKVLGDVCFLIECDAGLMDSFIKTVKKYRIRKKVEICDVSDQYRVWSVPSGLDPTQPVDDLETTLLDISDAVLCVPDPRVPQFGQRVIVKAEAGSLVDLNVSGERYKLHRYRWGIPEGPQDLPPSNCLPLESNLTIMNGVSFAKGCYIGQELTARTHHSGVVRKRLLPLLFDSPNSKSVSVEEGAKLSTEDGKNAGKLRGKQGDSGLGLVRLEHHAKPLFVSDTDGNQHQLSCYRPGWWPEELRK